MITIIDYGVGNIGSVFNMMTYLGVPVKVQSEPKEILKTDKLILPGVGSFDHAMDKLHQSPGLIEVLEELVLTKKKYILGICLGMQLFTEKSEEGVAKGLSWISGTTKKFRPKHNLKIPHIGWNAVKTIKKDQPLFKGLQNDIQFYFSHSYFTEVQDPNQVLTTTLYGDYFTSCLIKNNIIGAQFHPERSHKYGLRFMKNFAEL